MTTGELVCTASHHQDPDRPRRAADGLRVCTGHLLGAERHVMALPGIHADLAWVLTGSGGRGEYVSGTHTVGITLSDAVVEARTTIRHLLVAYTRMIHEDRGVGLPADRVSAMAELLKRHNTWLCAGEYAADWCDDMSTAYSFRRLAFPPATRRFPTGPCREPGCRGTLIAVLRSSADAELPAELVCDLDAEHAIASTDWIRALLKPRRHVTRRVTGQVGD